MTKVEEVETGGIRKNKKHWGRGYLETGGNMSGTLKGQDLFPSNVFTEHMSSTFVMFPVHVPYI